METDEASCAGKGVNLRPIPDDLGARRGKHYFAGLEVDLKN